MNSPLLRAAPFLLAAGLLPAPALAQITCLASQLSLADMTNESGDSAIPPEYILRAGSTTIRVYSAGIWVQTITVRTDGNSFQILQNGIPYTGDIVGNPSGFYDDLSASDILNSICPNGLTPSVNLRGNSRNAPSQRSTQPHTSTTSFATPAYGEASQPYAYGDFNGDGIIDTAIATPGAISVNLYGLNGNPTAISTTSRFAINSQYQGSIVTGDFNGDGVLDLAVTILTNSPPGMVAILLGKGDGTFGTPTYLAGLSGPLSIVAADFNGDGKLDLAVANQGSLGNVAILLGHGDGTFAAPVSYNAGQVLISLVATDLNGDGKLDLAALDSNDGKGDLLWVLLGSGDGTFQRANGGLASGTSFGALAYTDLNRDGKQDLLAADPQSNAIAVMLGKGDGTFQPTAEYVSAADPNSVAVMPLGDGTSALFTGDGYTGTMLLTFAGSNGFVNSPQIQTLGESPSAIGSADFNKDGRPDLVVTDGQGNAVYVELNSGGGEFANPVGYAVGASPTAAAIADVNGDGNPDLVVADGNGVDVLLGNGNGTFGDAQSTPVTRAGGSSPAGLAVGDFNSDGKPDAAVTVAGGQIVVLLGQGNGTFAAGTNVIPLPTGMVPGAILAGDVNGDGKLDLVVAYAAPNQFAAGTIAVFLGNGNGTFQAPTAISVPGIPESLGLGDVNKDGHPDLIAGVFEQSRTQLAILLGTSSGAFQSPSYLNTITTAASITVTDLNGDGNLDLMLGDCCEASYMLGDGNGTFQAEVRVPTGPNPGLIVAAELSGDGGPDLAIAGTANNRGTLTLFRNAFGTQTPANPATVLSSANPALKTIAPESLASAYGSDLATVSPTATSSTMPTSYGGTSVSIVDSKGNTTPAPLVYVSSTQVNFLIPATVATGAGQVTVTSGDGTQSTADVQLAAVAPGVFELNGAGLAAAIAQRYSADGTVTNEQVYTVNSAGAVVANPIDMGSSTDQVYLLLYGTGLQAAGTGGVTVSVGGINATVAYAGPSTFPGEDQVNVLLPRSLAGMGNVILQLTAAGIAANLVNLSFQ
jgi:uncharacterized protein (TIGR03437 family)